MLDYFVPGRLVLTWREVAGVWLEVWDHGSMLARSLVW
jgi:hypothetical protein